MKSLSELGVSPWPWYAVIFSNGIDAYIVCEKDKKTENRMIIASDVKENNASLFAAAPEMAKVCYDLIMWDRCRDASICDIVAAAKAAYAKASGEEAK